MLYFRIETRNLQDNLINQYRLESKLIEMEQYTLFNPQCIHNQQNRPKRKIKTAGTRQASTNIIFPDYFKTNLQQPFILDQSTSSNFRYSRQLMRRSQQSNLQIFSTKLSQQRAQTTDKGKYRSEYRLFKSEYESFYKQPNTQQKTRQGPERKIQSHNEPRYLVRKNGKWVINKIQKNTVKSPRQPDVQQFPLKKSKEIEDFVLMMSLSCGFQYPPSDAKFTISADSHPYVLSSIKKRSWWEIDDKNINPSLVWKQKCLLQQSQRYKVLPLSSLFSNQLECFKREYNLAKMIWPNSKPRPNAPFIRPQPPYLQNLKEQILQKIPSGSSRDMKLFGRIGHRKYLNNLQLFKLVENTGKYYPNTYFNVGQNTQKGNWIISQNGAVKVVNQRQLRIETQGPFDYFQSYQPCNKESYMQSGVIKIKEERMKAIVLIVSLNGLLKVYVYESLLSYSIQIQKQRIKRGQDLRVKENANLLGEISSLLHGIFSQIHKKLLTKVNCFEIFQAEIIPQDNPLLTSIKSVGQYSHPIYESVIQNVFLIVIDYVFRPLQYEYQSPYSSNRFNLIFDSFIQSQS